MARCGECNRFVGQEMRGEVQSVEGKVEIEKRERRVTGGTINVSVRIVGECTECGNEIIEATVEGETEIDAEAVVRMQAIVDRYAVDREKVARSTIVEITREAGDALTVPCGSCGEEVAVLFDCREVDGEIAICSECRDEAVKAFVDERVAEMVESASIEEESDEVEITDRVEGKGRGARTFYGANEVEVAIVFDTLANDDERVVVTCDVGEEQASYFDPIG